MSRNSLNAQKKVEKPLQDGGIHIEDQDQIQRSMSSPNLTVRQQGDVEPPQPQIQNERQQNNLQPGFSAQENRELVMEGIKELDAIPAIEMEEEILLDDVHMNESMEIVNPPIRTYVNRLKLERARKAAREKEQQIQAEPIKARDEMKLFRKNGVIKRGAFSQAALTSADSFMKKVNDWAGTTQALSHLYVDGMPLKEYVAANYGYQGEEDKQKEQAVLGAYVAMITARQNHAITLVCPTQKDGVADVDIRNLDVRQISKSDKRSLRADAVRYALRGEEYRKYCETVYRSSKQAEAGAKLREEMNIQIDGLNRLEELQRVFHQAGRGKHQNYNDFSYAFQRYFDALEIIAADPAHMNVDRETLQQLEALSDRAIRTANEYLKGKNMKLARHTAVRDLRDLISYQSGGFLAIKRSGKLEDGDAVVSLKDVLDRKEESFVVMGSETEVAERQKNREAGENVKNDYEFEQLDPDVELTRKQKLTMEMKRRLFADGKASYAFTRLKNAVDKENIPADTKVLYARTFLNEAANILINDEKYGPQVKRKFQSAGEDVEKLRFLVAEDQLRKVFASEFQQIPYLNMSVESWQEEVLSLEAKKMSYQSNTLGDQVSEKDYLEHGGSSAHLYVTAKEAAEIVRESDGFLCSVTVQGNKNLREIRPTMPEFTVLDKGQPTEERIPLRKTMNLMIKTILHMSMDENGHMKDQVDMYDGNAVTNLFDNLFRLDPGKENDARITSYNFMVEKLCPAMEEMLTQEFIKKGKSRRKAEILANNLAVDTAENFFKLIDKSLTNFISSFDSQLHYFRTTVSVLRNLDREAFMNDPKVKAIRINGEAPTRAEIEEALNEFMTETEAEEADLKHLRDLDIDSEESFNINACVDNAKFTETLQASFSSRKPHPIYSYKPSNRPKENPRKAIDYMLAHHQELFDAQGQDEAHRKDHLAKLQKLDAALRENGSLNRNEMDNLKSLYDTYAKYDTHRGANICQVGNDIITTETFASTAEKLINSPYTSKAHIGRYRSTKKDIIDDETHFHYHQGMKDYYDKDNYFSDTNGRKNVIKCNLKEIIRNMGNRMGDRELG